MFNRGSCHYSVSIDAMEWSELDFISEASTVLKEISFGVQEASLSQQLPCSPEAVYINLASLEGDRYCIHLDMCGYEVGFIWSLIV